MLPFQVHILTLLLEKKSDGILYKKHNENKGEPVQLDSCTTAEVLNIYFSPCWTN